MEDGGVHDELQALLAEAARGIDHPAALGLSAERALRALVRKSGMPAGIHADVSQDLPAAWSRP